MGYVCIVCVAMYIWCVWIMCYTHTYMVYAYMIYVWAVSCVEICIYGVCGLCMYCVCVCVCVCVCGMYRLSVYFVNGV